MEKRRTRVCIIGAGPSGLILSQLLHLNGITSIVIERRSREHVEKRVRAGLLEQRTVESLRAAAVGERLDREGMVHEGFELRVDGDSYRLPFAELTGASVWMYGQQEVVKDLISARLAADGQVYFGIDNVRVERVTSDGASVWCTIDGKPVDIECDFLAGCDGFHGVCRAAVPTHEISCYEQSYPFAWLGILATAVPMSSELIYAVGRRGFALQSMRSRTVSRLYLQVSPWESVHSRSDKEIWEELDLRLTGGTGNLTIGPVRERILVSLRSFVAEPMQYKSLFLVGDAAHVVPPSAAKGLNLAVADAQLLADGLVMWYQTGRRDALDSYAAMALRRAWMGQEFSAWMTSFLHVAPDESVFDSKIRRARFDHLRGSSVSAAHFAEQYVGLSRW
jgi:p-hydroxybenzoate 3-monooxygenase